MKRQLLLFAFMVFSIGAFAQETIIEELDNSMLQKYIQLAKTNFPRKKTFDNKVERSKSALNMAKTSWFDVFNAGYYYTPTKQTGNFIAPGTGGTVNQTGQLVVTGFTAGVSVNLGSLLSKPSVVKMAKADHELAKLESLEYDNILANEVKSRYYDYLLAKKQLTLRTVSAQSYKTIIADAKSKYEKAEIPIETYTAARMASTESEALALTAEVAFLKAKNNLEDIIGTKLENVK